MTCQEVRATATWHVNLVPPIIQELVGDHLKTCGDCRTWMNQKPQSAYPGVDRNFDNGMVYKQNDPNTS